MSDDSRRKDGWFFLYPWAREYRDARRVGRRASDRATTDHNPTDDSSEQVSLEEISDGSLQSATDQEGSQ